MPPEGGFMSRRFWVCTLVVFAGWATVGFAAPPPGTSIWDGGGSDNKWSTGLNWADNVAPTHDGSANIIMAGTVQLVGPFVDSPWSITSLTFDPSAGAFSVTGFTLSIDRTGITNNSVNFQTINSPVELRGPSQWNAAAGPMLLG